MPDKMKACPLLVQSDTTPSLTISGESYTRVYFLQCIGDRCAAYKDGCCKKFDCQTREAQDG